MSRMVAGLDRGVDDRPLMVYCVGEGQDGARLDHFLKERIPALSRRRVQQAIAARVWLLRAAHLRAFPVQALPGWLQAVRPDARRRPRAATQVRAGDRVAIWPDAPHEPDETWEVPILHSDPHLLAADKPAGLVVHATRRRVRHTLLAILRRRLGEDGLSLAHRIDRETSGIVLLARDLPTARALSDAFAAGQIRKTYLAVVRGAPSPRRGRIDLPIGSDRRSGIHVRRAVSPDGAAAITDYAVAARLGLFSLVRLRPHSGRRHQIRVHLEAIGHPIVGDKLYGGDPRWYVRFLERGDSEEMRRALGAARHLLHASEVEFRHPASGRRLRLRSPLPADMRERIEGEG
jgi:23S rRNA pseudouridine1911/1915/1917 synthase